MKTVGIMEHQYWTLFCEDCGSMDQEYDSELEAITARKEHIASHDDDEIDSDTDRIKSELGENRRSEP